MTNEEFNDWFDDFSAAFPWAKDFVSKDGRDGMATRTHWLGVLSRCDLADAKEVTRMMLAGDLDEVSTFERHATPRHVAGLCAKLARERLEPPADDSDLEFPPREANAEWASPGICKQLMDAAAAGEDTHALALRLMPVDERNEPRYKCLHCLDRGHLRVWHRDSMKLAARGELTTKGRCYSTSIRCLCSAGEKWGAIGRGRYDFRKHEYPLPGYTYDPKLWCVCKGYRQADVEALEDFMANIKPPGHDEAWDTWNQTEVEFK